MRKIVGILLCLFSFAVYAQHDTDITIGVVVPQTQSELDSKSFHLLATRLENVMGTIGISSSVNDGIILYPEVNILSKQLVEGGLRNITIVELELSLFVKQVMTQTLFGSCSKVLKGSGRTFSDAVCNAFINIKPQDEVYGNFLKQSKEKIVRYYWDNKDNIINQARKLGTAQQYEEALALLMTYPQNLNGAEDVWKAAVDIYKKYQNQKCSQLILQAKGFVTSQDYDEAISVLSQIDVESSCYSEALNILKQIDKSIRDDQREEKEFINKLIDQEFDLKTRRIDAIKSVASAFINSLPQIAQVFK